MNMPASETINKPQQLDLSPKTFDEAWRFCEIVTSSGLAPKGFAGKPNDAFIAIQWGNEIGLKPMQSLQNIAVVNGRPSLWGDAVLAVVLASPSCEDVIEYFEGNPGTDSYTAVCIAKRFGKKDKTGKFSIADAKQAKLWGKDSPWSTYPTRMLQMRARGFGLRDQFPDVLKGMPITEEVMDYQEREVGPGAGGDTEDQPKYYPDEAFEKNFAKWKSAIETGKSTHEMWVETLSKKGALTEEQLQRIHEVKAPIEGEVTENANS